MQIMLKDLCLTIGIFKCIIRLLNVVNTDIKQQNKTSKSWEKSYQRREADDYEKKFCKGRKQNVHYK